MRELGNFTEDQVASFTFNTRQADGTPITFAGTPSLAVYKDGGLTQSTAGLTLTVDFDSVTGLHKVAIDTSADAFYAAGSDYSIVVAAGTVDGTSVVGETLASFSIENRFDEVDVTKVGGSAQSATDLKDFADAGYDPATNKIQGVVLVDTTTVNTDMRGTESALLAANVPTNFSALGINAGGDIDRVTLVDTTTVNTDMVAEAPTAVQNRQEMDNNSTQLAALIMGQTTLGGGQTSISALIAALQDLSAEDIRTILDLAADNKMDELTGPVGARPSFREGLMRRYHEDSGYTSSTAALKTIRNNAGTPIITQVVGDDGTTNKHEADA